MGFNVTDEIWVFETRDAFERKGPENDLEAYKEETKEYLFYNSN
jgi:hypothetical protein